MNKLSTISAAVASVGLMVAPVAAQAGTRAGSSPVTIDVQRASAGTGEANELGQFNLAWLLLLLAVIAALVAALSGGRTRGG